MLLGQFILKLSYQPSILKADVKTKPFNPFEFDKRVSKIAPVYYYCLSRTGFGFLGRMLSESASRDWLFFRSMIIIMIEMIVNRFFVPPIIVYESDHVIFDGFMLRSEAKKVVKELSTRNPSCGITKLRLPSARLILHF